MATPENFDSALGQRIRERRTSLELSQNALARELDLSFQAVSKWERGENAPDLRVLPGLARVLGVSIDWLLGQMPGVILTEAPALRGLSNAELSTVRAYAKQRECAANTLLFSMGAEPHEMLYLLLSGQVEIRGGSPARQISAVASGEFFSDYSFFDPAPCVTEARVVSDASVLVWDQRGYGALQHDHPGIALTVLQNEVQKAVRYFREQLL